MEKKIAITIQNFVQFYSVKPFIDLSSKYNIDIFVPIAIDDCGVKEMFDDIYNYLVKNNYNVYRESDMSIKYKILLEPYPMDIYLKFNYEYRIKYKYSAISAKPNLIYKAESNIFYDAILCYSTYETEILSNFSKTYLVGKLNYIDFKKKKVKDDKKTLLYLPTYGDYNSIDDIVEELEQISDKYNIITKEHHGTNYLKSEKYKSKKLMQYISKFYDSSYPLSKLLEISDVVLSDNSGSIFEALYSNVPVCIFSKNMHEFSLDNIDSLQYSLVKSKVIPYTNNKDKLSIIIDQALSDEYVMKQNDMSKCLFPISNNKILSSFTDAIDLYLNDNINIDSFKLHKKNVNNYELSINCSNDLSNLKKINEQLNIENNNLRNEKEFIEYQLNEYKKGKLYKIATKIYSFKANIRRKK